ncbi:MAG TPA: aminotransferase class I/II-fold pyridoxal phosphate-dependent enzyme [Oscillospiraceae bacterium]|nr:aminotransferase class I/II-fold pyridoxal phosphate-dependent enzyme [Oscillospiraceae bacterium]HRW56711.1 aminotransferase class I/II-fold pyridoxal phosphate-dependent enzyme [Oscillospiraceae bacterium]
MPDRHLARKFQNVGGGSLALDTAALSRYDDIIDLSIGDTDFITDRRIIDAAYRDACAGYTKYGDPKGDPMLVEAIRNAYREDFGMELSPAEVFITASSCMGMELCLTAIINPGDEVLVFSPYFSPYKDQIELAGGAAVDVPTSEEDGWAIREDLLRAKITSRTRAMIFNNPTNPTGAVYDRPTMEMLARVAEEFDLIVIADEIYTRYLYEGKFIPFRSLPGMAERTLTLNSFSKNFMMTGWRVGCIVAPSQILTAVAYISNGMIYTVPSISQRAALAALAIRDDIEKTYISQFKGRVYYAYDRASRIPWMTATRPRGTFYLFPGIKKTGLSSPEFCRELFEKAHILAAPGNVFGEAGEGYFRIVCAVGIPVLEEAFDRMEKLSFPQNNLEI